MKTVDTFVHQKCKEFQKLEFVTLFYEQRANITLDCLIQQENGTYAVGQCLGTVVLQKVRALLLLNKTIMKKLSETIVILRLCEPDTKKLKL
ncbi:hypothetical protein P5673_000001 [Acropora cervicornis]|uniref:Uncharacterized protein n=1 Tax=Acropora cervicornis TaxID=6130 RepID=A0AAD9R6E5_ACRCE|nr:hypothetical protein P5673_000001 [Acropora cervicornis]